MPTCDAQVLRRKSAWSRSTCSGGSGRVGYRECGFSGSSQVGPDADCDARDINPAFNFVSHPTHTERSLFLAKCGRYVLTTGLFGLGGSNAAVGVDPATNPAGVDGDLFETVPHVVFAPSCDDSGVTILDLSAVVAAADLSADTNAVAIRAGTNSQYPQQLADAGAVAVPRLKVTNKSGFTIYMVSTSNTTSPVYFEGVSTTTGVRTRETVEYAYDPVRKVFRILSVDRN